MKKIGLFLVKILSILFVLGSLAWIGYQVVLTVFPEVGYRYSENKAKKVKSLITFGDKHQYVSVVLNSNELTGNDSISQNYFVTVGYIQRVDSQSNELKFDEGESIQVTTYDLNSPDTSKEFDLVPLLLKQGFNHQIFNTEAITFKGQDFLHLQYYTSDVKIGHAWYNIESGEVTEPLGNYLNINESFGNSYWDLVLGKINSDFNVITGLLALNATNEKAKNLDTTNLSLEEPDIAKNLTNGGAVYARPDLEDKEAWFNTVIHWFAPQGQDVMELYATDKATGEKTQIKSYADFEAWKAAHPDDDE